MRRRTGEAERATGARGVAIALAAALALALAAPARAGAADVRLEARVDRTTVAVGEVLALEVRLESPEPPTALELPDDPAFEIVSRAQSSGQSFAMGPGGVEVRRTLVARLGLAPARAGDLTVPAVVAVVGGKRYQTRPIAVKVLPAGTGTPRPGAPGPDPDADPDPAPPPRTGGGTFRGWERDLVLDVQVDRREAFLGEQVTMSIWLYSPLGVVDYQRFSPPGHDGFWSEELETPKTIQPRVRTIRGIPTRAYLLQRVALFPTRAGALELGPAELQLSVRVGGSSAFDPFPEVRRVTRRSAPVAIQVKPLPPGAPPGFESVNVGRLALAATAPDTEVAAGEPVAVRLTASGEGNVRALALPRLPELPGARAFEPTLSEQAAPRGVRFAGARTRETVLVPDRAGELVIPPVEWSWFDPSTARYETARTGELRVKVRPGTPGAAVALGGPAAGSNALLAGLRPIRSDSALARRSGPPWRSPLFVTALVLPPLGLAGLALADRLRARAGATSARRRAAARTARRRLARARRELAGGETGAALAEAARALVAYATDRLGRPAAGLTRDALGAALAGAGAHAPAVRALLDALDRGDGARFGGAGAAEEVLAAAERALALLEEADRAATGEDAA
jgi:hypothetical protein